MLDSIRSSFAVAYDNNPHRGKCLSTIQDLGLAIASPKRDLVTGYEKSPDYGDPPGNSGLGVIIVMTAAVIALAALILA